MLFPTGLIKCDCEYRAGFTPEEFQGFLTEEIQHASDAEDRVCPGECVNQ